MRVLRVKADEDYPGDIVACLPQFRGEIVRKSEEDGKGGEEGG